MNKSSLLSITTTLLCATALSACWLSEDDKAAVANFEFKPITGYTEGASEEVTSVADGEGPINTRYEVEFTADQTIKIVDTTIVDVDSDSGHKEYEFGAGDVHHALEFNDILKAYGSFASKDTSGAPDYDFESITIFTPTNTSNNDYAIARLVDTANDEVSWMLIGVPTSAILSGTANYSGGYYLMSNGPADTSQGELTLTADFGASTIGFTLTKPTNDVSNAAFGANTATFGATINGNNEIIASNAVVGGGGHYDSADVAGAFFYGGDNAAGLVRLYDSTNTVDDAFGGFNAIKD
jgi:hypothetical protein